MSYDGMYSELSTRGTSSQILTQVLEVRDQVLISEANIEILEASTVDNAALAQSSATTAVSSAASASTSEVNAAISASSAAQSAIDAETNSEAALIVANNAAAVANSANNLANQADLKADEALATANGIAATANTALSNSNAAVATANAAEDTANGIAATANTALSNSETAIDTADAAVVTANAASAAVASKQDGDPMLTALSGLTTSNDKSLYFQGPDNPVLYDLTDLGRNIVGSANAPAVRTLLGIVDSSVSLIEGLDFYRSAAGTIKVGVGKAYIPSLSGVLLVSSELTLTLTGLTTNSMYHIYLYSSSGTPTLEFSTTAPVLYQAPSSYQKTGDNSRRYIGSFIASSSTDCYKFQQVGHTIMYVENNISGLLALLSNGRATTATNVSCGSVVPITAVSILFSGINNIDTNLIVAIGNADIGSTPSVGVTSLAANNRSFLTVPLTSAQQISYAFVGAGASGGFFVQAQGYTFRR